ncbi:MAG: glycosyltransferase family 2 protein [Hydrogenophaga sp.]|jgi:glycosyltransferase involved in cell wall biosynthesis|nr:glycosyltransferase family 2 protein [Hydrogenophaga sp.]
MRTYTSHYGPPTLTVAILSLNEAHRIASCIRSACFADEVVLVDAGSVDGTPEIARALGAQVFIYPDWQGFSVQRDRLLAHATSDYVFFLDADEEISPDLSREIREVVASGEKAVWALHWVQIAFGRQLTRMKSSGNVERLFWRSDVRSFEGVVHEHAVLHEARPVLQLRHRLTHHSRETIYGSLLKMTQYAHLGAIKRLQKGKTGGIFRGALSGATIFTRLYIFRRGFLCGPEGFLYCMFAGLEAFFRYVALEYDRERLEEVVKR